MINLKSSLKKRYKTQTRDKNLGSHLKRRRLELNRNQDWVARGICSVSYLSKIENNKAEENQLLVKEIMQRLEVDPKLFQINIEDEQYLSDAIKALYFNENEKLEEIYHQVKDVEHNLTINLVKLCYMIDTPNNKTEALVMMLEQVIANMNDLDLQAFLVFAGFFYEKQLEYLFAYELFEISLNVHQVNEYLTALANAKLFEIKQYLLKKNSSVKHSIEAERLMQKHHNHYRLNKLNLTRVEYLLKEDAREAYETLNALHIKEFKGSLLDYYHLLFAKVSKELDNLEALPTYLAHIGKDSEYYIDALFLRYQLAEEEEEKRTIKKTIDDLKNIKHKMSTMIQFRLLYEENIDKRKEYLKDVAIPYAKKVHNLDLFFEFAREITTICMTTSRYKEATQYIKAYVKEKEKVHQLDERVAIN